LSVWAGLTLCPNKIHSTALQNDEPPRFHLEARQRTGRDHLHWHVQRKSLEQLLREPGGDARFVAGRGVRGVQLNLERQGLQRLAARDGRSKLCDLGESEHDR